MGHDDETKTECPHCKGKGQTETRKKSGTVHSIIWSDCLFCLGARMVTTTRRNDYKRWKAK